MIPQRFVYEYPQRCIQLIDWIEREAIQQKLVGSFAFMIASSLFLVPYERAVKKPPLGGISREPELFDGLRRQEKSLFPDAELWDGSLPGDWRCSRIMNDPDSSDRWRDPYGQHPLLQSSNTIHQRRF